MDTRTKELHEMVYELKIRGRGKYTWLTAEAYDAQDSEIPPGIYPVTQFWRLGPLMTMWRDERGGFEKSEIEKLILQVEEEWKGYDTKGKPFFVNGFMFTRRTGKTKVETYNIKINGQEQKTWETWHESPVEFYQVEVDLSRRLK